MTNCMCAGRLVRGGLAVGIGAALLAFATASATQSQKQRPQIGPSESDMIYPDQAAPLTPDPGMDHVWAPILQPTHPPISEIPYMPMPEVVDVPTRLEESQPIVHDAETGETWTLPLMLNGLDGAGVGGDEFTGADGRVEAIDEAALGFGTMFAVGPATTFPRRANVKLIMRFVDQGGTNRFFACSGCMLDAGVVATAGHCVYARNPNGINIFAFASEIWVYPGWDGNNNGTIFNPPGANEVIQHWGWARSTTFGAWTGWTQNGDFNWDWGIIRLNRNNTRSVGALTGWFGWAYGGSCNFSQTTFYQNYSFPAENCPTAGLHTGRDMYFWSGSYDSCVDTNRLEINTGGNCLDSVWGGMSGSGAYYVDAEDVRRIHAVCSYRQSGSSPQYGGYVRMWEAFHDFLLDFRATTRGNTFDLEALQYRIDGSLTVPAGQAMGGGSVRIVNATNASSGPATRTLRVYLSTDNNITSSDTLLAVWNYNNIDFAPMQVRTFNVPGPTIPVSTTPGNYWVGVILDSGTDSNPSNNSTRLWDAQPITVLGDPNSCAGNCGGQAPGGCWCDASCVGFGDCCDDACQHCGLCYTGACCFNDQTCQQLTQADCVGSGGNYMGDQTECASVVCPDPFSCAGHCGGQAPAGCWCDSACVGFGDCCNDACQQCGLCYSGACCLNDGSCTQLTQAACAAAGGTYHGDLTSCDTTNCPQPPDLCPGNLNGDGAVDVSDLLILLGAWGACADCGNCPADLNGDCVVDVSDLLMMLSNWGLCGCGEPFSCGSPIPWCDASETCFCAAYYNGATACFSAAATCGGACPDGVCPPGFVCLVNTCCGETTCVSEDFLCQ